MRNTGRLLRFSLIALATTTLLTTAQAQTPKSPVPLSDAARQRGFELLPQNSWIDAAVARLVHHGIAGNQEGRYPTWDGQRHTRYEAAVFTAKALDRGERSYEWEDRNRQWGFSPTKLNYDADDVVALRKLTQELMPELQIIGFQPADLLQIPQHMAHVLRFGGISPAFPDVPKDHWAFASVERLRKAGIVIGYEDGTFNSDAPK